MEKLAGGDLGTVVPGAERRDEVGGMATAVLVFKDGMAEADRLRSTQEAAKQQAAAEQKALLRRMADEFEAKIGHLIGVLSGGSAALETTAQSMTGAAQHGNRQAMSVASAAEKASVGLQTVASAADQLTASIGEIGRQVAQSARITGRAVDDARRTDAVVQALAQGAEKIGEVVNLITNIAAQTNLLALNATIEAARAGDAEWLRRVASEAEPGQPDRESDRGNRRADHPDPGRDEGGGGRDSRHHRYHRGSQRHRNRDCLGGRAAGRRNVGDRAQCATNQSNT